MIEIWEDISGYDGDYQVSNTGMVRSTHRVVVRKNGRSHTVRERILKAATDRKGYLRCALTKNGKLSTHKVHRLVADSFCKGEIRDMSVDHLNGTKSDNRAENLEIVTFSENTKRSFANGLQPKVPSGFDNPRSKLSRGQVEMIKECYFSEINLSVKKDRHKPFTKKWLARAFGSNAKTISKILSGKMYLNG